MLSHLVSKQVDFFHYPKMAPAMKYSPNWLMKNGDLHLVYHQKGLPEALMALVGILKNIAKTFLKRLASYSYNKMASYFDLDPSVAC